MKPHVILFLAANPRDTGRLALDVEARAIQDELKGSARFRFEAVWAAEPRDLLRAVRELRPTILHFSGHGGGPDAASSGSRDLGAADDVPASRDSDAPASPDVSSPADAPASRNFGAPGDAAASRDSGLILQGEHGAQWVSGDAVADALGAAGASVKLVVLNACFTEPMATALLAHVDCVVGVTGAILDDAARHFATDFYGALGQQQSVASAVVQGRAALALAGLAGAGRVQLAVRAGVDASQLVLAATVPERRRQIPCPFPGMRPYTAEEASRFRGREGEIADLIGRLRAGERLIYVIGPSGSGKSSLIASGVVPQLARASNLPSYVVRSLRPGEQPARCLRDALDGSVAQLLAGHHPRTHLLLIIDQLEELFTLASADEQAAFLAELRAVLAEPRAAVILALRADFYGTLMESPLWPGHGRLSRIEVSPLRGDALGGAIAAPAREAGVEVEPALLERLLADAACEPGALPLLQETLVQLWDCRTDQSLTLEDYAKLGDGAHSGLAVALARRADATIRPLSAAQVALARRIVLRLISFGEGRSDTRRPQPRSQLRAADDHGFEVVLQTMIDARLLAVDDSAGEPRVDLAHEVMITAWPRLADWVRAHRVDEQRRRRLEDAAAQWIARRRGSRGLLDSHELVDAVQWQATESAMQLGDSENVRSFIAASRAAQRQLRWRRRLFLGVAGVAALIFSVFLALTVIARADAEQARAQKLIANQERNHALEQTHKAERSDRKNHVLIAQSYFEAGRQLVIAQRFPEALPYLLAARRHGQDSAALRTMFAEAIAQVSSPSAVEPGTAAAEAPARDDAARTQRSARASPGPKAAAFFVNVDAISSDGALVVGERGVLLWHLAAGAPVALEHPGVTYAAVSRDATRIVTTGAGAARLWNATTGNVLATLDVTIRFAAFSPDSRRLATGNGDQLVHIWDATTGDLITGPLRHDGVRGVAFSADGTRVLTTGDRSSRVWDVATGAAIATLEHDGVALAAPFSPDGTRIITADLDRRARIWSATTGALLHSLAHVASVRRAVFSPDGKRVATASTDNTAQIWDATTGAPLTDPLAHGGIVWTVAFSPDGQLLVTASSDTTAQLWDAISGKPIRAPFRHPTTVRSALFSADGQHVITVGHDRTARVWNVGSDAGTLDDWATAAARSAYVLNDQGVLVSRAR